MRRAIIAMALFLTLSAHAIGDDWYRPLSMVAYYPPNYLYYTEVYEENSCEQQHFKEVIYYLHPAPLLTPLPIPCPPDGDLLGGTYGPAPIAEEDDSIETNLNEERSAHNLLRGASFHGWRLKLREKENFLLPPSCRTAWEAVTPSGGKSEDRDFISFVYDNRQIHAKIFQIRLKDDSAENLRKRKTFIAVEAKTDKGIPVKDVKPCGGRYIDQKHYVLTATYEEDRIMIFLANEG